MKSKKANIFSIFMIIIAVVIIALSILKQSALLLFFGIFLIVVTSILAILLPSLSIFKHDHIIDKESLLKQGLHITICQECGKENVYEDKYCVFCGEKLVNNDETI